MGRGRIRRGLRIYTVITFLLGPLLIIWFAGFPIGHTWAGTWQIVFHFIHETLVGQNLYQLYSGSTWPDIYYTYRLIVVAIIFAYGFGWLLTLIPILVHWRPFLAIYDTIFVFLESVPDVLYIIGTNLLMIVLLERYNINLPVVESVAPTWYTTLIPAFVLCLPSMFYLKRLWNFQLQEEASARYIDTAAAKGASRSRILFRHILPNIGPISLAQLPFVATMVISTSLFAELFLEYQGQLWAFMVATGFKMESGILGNPYHMGLVVVIGIILVVLWRLIQLLTRLGQRTLVPAEGSRPATPSTRHIQVGWIVVGGLMVGLVLFAGAFPQLFTHFRPNYQDLANNNPKAPPWEPWPPSAVHPFGTDILGHDTLSQLLYGVYNSLYPAAIITVVSVVLGTAMAIITAVSPRRWLVMTMRMASTVLSSIPALFLLFLALYHRTDVLWLQLVQYILWFVAFEALRGSYAIYVMLESWFHFDFVEGALSVGRSRLGTLFSHLWPWLGSFLLEHSLTTFVRVISIMTQLATFHMYAQAVIGKLPFDWGYAQNWPQGVVSAHVTWFGLIGDAAFNGVYLWDPASLAGPVLIVAVLTVGVNLITHGLRGNSSNPLAVWHMQSR